MADYTDRPHEINEVAGFSKGALHGPRSERYDKHSFHRSSTHVAFILHTPVRPSSPETLALFQRIADALERLAPPSRLEADFNSADAFVWHAAGRRLSPVPKVNRVEMSLLRGIDRVRDILSENTDALRQGPARQQRPPVGCPRHGQVLAGQGGSRGNQPPARASDRAAQADRDPPRGYRDAAGPDGVLRSDPHRFIIFCDDLSFDSDDTSYKSLKAVLEGGIEGRPDNVIFYATSNRRHLMPRDMMDNERSTAINPGEAVEEKVSLSDRFGLWLGFHKCSQDEYLDMVFAYVDHLGLEDRPRRHPRRGTGMGDDPRRALRAHGVAVHPGSGRADGQGDLSSPYAVMRGLDPAYPRLEPRRRKKAWVAGSSPAMTGR